MKSVFFVCSLLLLLLPFFAAADGTVAANGDATGTSSTTTTTPSDPNLVSTPAQAGLPTFSWVAGVTSTGTTSPNDRIFSFQTLDGDKPDVGYVDLHYSINNQVISNWRMTNATSFSYFTHTVTLQNSDIIEFNFTYLSLATNTADDTYTYKYSIASNQITQVTIVTIPSAGSVVLGDYIDVDTDSGFKWRPAVQLYTNVPYYYSVEFQSTSVSRTNDWVNVHYIINSNGVDGPLKNFLMTKNDSLASVDGSDYFFLNIENVLNNDILKFNFTYWDSILQAAVDTKAFLWSPTSNVINDISSINDQNVQVNPSGGQAVYGSTGAAGPSTQAGGVNSTTTGTTTNGNNNNGNTNSNTNNNRNSAVGQQAGTVMTVACIVAAMVATML